MGWCVRGPLFSPIEGREGSSKGGEGKGGDVYWASVGERRDEMRTMSYEGGAVLMRRRGDVVTGIGDGGGVWTMYERMNAERGRENFMLARHEKERT